MDERKVKRIYHPPAVPAADLFKGVKQRRVAAYARVSTASDEQLNSVEAQKNYFAKLIHQRPDWIFVGVYADKGITGTSINRREAFNRMVTDALTGNIDLIVTKSISRFARNTVDTLNTIRQLKAANVEVFFEKENIYTMDSKGEFLITLLSSIAEEESRSISENVKWGQRKRFADGKYSVPYKHFLGYRKGADGIMEIVPEEARAVRWIYHMFLEGIAPTAIATILTTASIPSPAGGDQWWPKTVMSILTNEKYYGAARLQKKFTVDFLEKKMKPNEGEVPQYYVTGSHPAIIEPDEWEQVQAEFARRKALGKAYSGKSVLSAKLVCEDCGAFFGSKVWHSTDQYRRTIWQCNGKFANEERCHTPVVDTETIQRLFIKAYNLMMQDRVQIIKQCEAWRVRLMDFRTLDADIERQLAETQVVAELVKAAVKENSSTAQSQEAYLKKYEALTERYEKAAAELERLQSLRTARSQQDKKMALYIRTLKKQPEVMHDWNDTIWTVMIEKAIVHKDGQITFVFQNGTEIKVGA